ncbi:MAG TPA: phosphoenolpyruvate--protein phosphotransferase [Candidatus Sumerlaeota bacterium]|nr:MAG: Phosphoenolpyruvate-protein phosphotransferase [candidate division BRC1 bacterium ADurb.BinA292]HOE96027.1 phosphoenolpyruvate--protein phosphotransferase [Candidatus Sumerlaeota bacterium]HOR27499.1 phosphoenolpyruvate--protein phosphotransferase [Candidatus Sumerlaeota bacterium]HPK01003.1 phosphoenolpyruvate--protein phosphotransferase [Candidatus Sumerlaeota bacterium]
MTPTAPKPASRTYQGIAVSPGIYIGKIHVYDPVQTVVPHHLVSARAIENEKKHLREALAKAKEELQRLRERVRDTLDEAHASIFDPQLMILEDPAVVDSAVERIEKNQENASRAFMTIIRQFVDKFSSVGDPYLASRNSDILDVGNRVCQHLAQVQPESSSALQFDSEVIVLARDLSPSDTAQMDQLHVKGFATELGGPTSHTAILAKALEIPAVVGLGPFLAGLKTGTQTIIDGYEGTITIDPSPREIARARQRRKKHLVHERYLQKLKHLPAETIDGYRVDLAANVELPIEIPHVLAHGAEGIGLFRTEFQYLENDRLPGEEELFEVYRKVVEVMDPHPVIFRTIDLGGDKFLGALQTGRELNPFLGLRAIRLCLAHPEVFRTQLRAILRASAHGSARIMFPMISNVAEVRQAREMLDEVAADLRRERIPFDEEIQIGVMIEIPSAAITADQLAREVDFFSIGTNDLIQYTLAVDRGNEQVAHLYEPFHPAILRLIRNTIDAAQREGIWVGLCGEMSANPLCALLLLGMGIDELSMGALAIPEIKRLIRQVELTDARRLVEEVYSLRTAEEIREHVLQAYRGLQRKRARAGGMLRAI